MVNKSTLYICSLMVMTVGVIIGTSVTQVKPDENQIKLQHLIAKREELRVCLAILKSDAVYSNLPSYCE